MENIIFDIKNIGRYPLTAQELKCVSQVSEVFKVKIPACYLDLIDWSDFNDPLRKQVIPTHHELDWHDQELKDPIGDHTHSPFPRLVHRYPDRVLLYPTLHCAITCRHCFRKDYLSSETGGFSKEKMTSALEYVSANEQILEVIFSGGDPFMLADNELSWLYSQLEKISHLRMIRIHTRIPAVLPDRITSETVNALRGRLMVCVVTHFNHFREITPATQKTCRLLREAGFILLSQSVLLKGVNDNIETLSTLFRNLVYDLGVKPYYLHHCDLARGLRHFRTSIDDGLKLMNELRGHVSGICLPHYMLDLPGGHGKIPLGPSYVEGRDAHKWLFRSYLGEKCYYNEILGDVG